MNQPLGAPPVPHERSAPDPEVCRAIYRVGMERHVSGKVMLAAFETGIVESSMQNIPGGDRDSLGVFQQRPSQGWGSAQECMTVDHAAREFFKHAVSVEETRSSPPG